MRVSPSRRRSLGSVWLLSVASSWLSTAALLPAQPTSEAVGAARIRVATKDAPPFSFRGEDGEWRGISIELWRLVADDLGIQYELVERTVPQMFAQLGDRQLDAAVAGLTMTSEREAVVDFSLPFLRAGLGVAAREGQRLGWVGVVRRVASPAFLRVLMALFALLLVSGCLVWLFERRANPEQFGGPPLHGLANGIWWAAVTMTTVGYGDKAPRTPGGRLVALVWMFASLVVLGGFIASIASTLTLGAITPRIRTASDLADLTVGVIEGTTSAQYAEERALSDREYPDVLAALEALEAGQVDAVIHDRPILRFTVSQRRHPSLEVLDLRLTEDYYGLAFQEGSELREMVNRSLLRMWASGDLARVENSYLGRGDEPSSRAPSP